MHRFSKRAIRRYLLALDQLQQALFACYSEKGEDSLHIARARCGLFYAVRTLRAQRCSSDFSGFERLYESIFMLGQLRFRVTDPALFEVCRQELSDLTHSLSRVLQSVCGPDRESTLVNFDGVRGAFQDLYDGVLCITAREPQVFQFFFSHLNAFRMELSALIQGGAFDHFP